jgi:Glycosyl hydrolase family 20, domain 2/Glycosyl hydrolase family 20, catalytic domain
MKKMIILPEPKKITLENCNLSLNHDLKILSNKASESVANKFAADLRNLKGIVLKVEPVLQDKNVIAIVRQDEKGIHSLPDSRGNLCSEGYILEVNSDSAVICASDQAGLFYGTRSFLQLAEQDEEIRGCLIEDWPDLEIRGIHLDLKGVMPTFEYLCNAIKTFSTDKLNTVLIEYEDKFTFEKHPLISSSCALTQKQIRELLAIGKEHFIEFIPLIQCLGHVEYVLKHKEYVYAAEENEIQQYCPSKPEAFELFKEFTSEILELHSDSKYVHIGGDEARFIGKCATCAATVTNSSKGKLYIDYIKKVCLFIKAQGKIPIIWSDMLININNINVTKELPEDIIIMYWQYDAKSEKIPFLNYKNPKISGKWLEKDYFANIEKLRNPLPVPYYAGTLEEIPETVTRDYKKYWDIDEFPMWINSLPYLDMFRDRNYKVWGGAGIRTSKDDQMLSNFSHAANVRLWANKIFDGQQQGVISTAWSRGNSLNKPTLPFELCWYGVLASAEYYWTAQEQISEKDFDEKFIKRFWGTENKQIIDAMYLLEISCHETYSKLALGKIKKVKTEITKNKLSFEYLEVFAELQIFTFWQQSIFSFIEARYYNICNGSFPLNELLKILNWLNDLQKQQPVIKNKMKTILAKTMPPEEVTEFLNSRFCLSEKRLTEYIDQLKNYKHI